METSHGKLLRDLCPLCIHAKFVWIPIYSGGGTVPKYDYERIIRYELSKRCYGNRGLKKLFGREERYFGVCIERIVTSCPSFSNASLFGFSSNPNNFREILRKMPKIDSEIAEFNPPEEGHNYRIDSANIETTDVSGFKAVRVTMVEVGKTKPYKPIRVDGEEIQKTTMLWLREQAGTKSKLGAFLLAFLNHFSSSEEEEKDEEYYKNTDVWVGNVINVVHWKERNREIKVLS